MELGSLGGDRYSNIEQALAVAVHVVFILLIALVVFAGLTHTPPPSGGGDTIVPPAPVLLFLLVGVPVVTAFAATLIGALVGSFITASTDFGDDREFNYYRAKVVLAALSISAVALVMESLSCYNCAVSYSLADMMIGLALLGLYGVLLDVALNGMVGHVLSRVKAAIAGAVAS